MLQNKKPTIVALKNTRCELGQREGLSDTDILKLNKLYQVKTVTWKSESQPKYLLSIYMCSLTTAVGHRDDFH